MSWVGNPCPPCVRHSRTRNLLASSEIFLVLVRRVAPREHYAVILCADQRVETLEMRRRGSNGAPNRNALLGPTIASNGPD